MTVVRTRFAPSPTGFLHIGSLRTALYAYALAKKSKGDFILRIEDTDQKREVEGAVEALKSTLFKFGLKWDEIYIQSKRKGLYQKAAQKLVLGGHAFYCQCQAKNAKEEGFSSDLRDPCREKNLTSGAVKLKVPDGEIIKYFDFVHKKEISWNSTDVYDATLLKSDGFPTYHLAVAVDDIDMKISHIIRGHDWLPSTPIHLLVFKYLGGPTPQIGHPTDILSSETGKKLSKRRDSVFAEQFLEEGYLPEALLNFVMLLGWAPSDNRELYTLDEFVENFDIKGFQEANPKFFKTKLDWFNGTYIRKLTVDELNSKFIIHNSKFAELSEDKQLAITKLLQERITKISDLNTLGRFFWEEVEPDRELFTANRKDHLADALEIIKDCEPFDLETLNNHLMDRVKTKGYKTGDFFMDLRVAVAGARFTPPINESIIILGKEETVKRIEKHVSPRT
ncbi:glutamate--tRNA ligase [Candidatus Woesebacteria bacterium RIFOXYA1_FULL_43_9]|uniref:Glutamate--tRNA ligase n=1 Tax=Candidatus Woesebacteria bacterium RIFOXYA1_FULL_43_9 TaxID=1802534 RepID=A0A1F8CNM9_9BACT|nr:MAG: glutamate--tRNA ligase [Candidatus Woesebacteria bacterium RIFOXYA1_FULL_43_9]